MAILKHIKTLSALLLITLLTGCYTDFTPDIEVQNKLCLNSVITADEPIILSLTRTYRYDEGDPDLGGYFDTDSVFHEVTGIGSEATKHIDIVLTDKDASVSLYVNDQYVEDLKYKQYLDSKFFWQTLSAIGSQLMRPKRVIRCVLSQRATSTAMPRLRSLCLMLRRLIRLMLNSL
jgi:hypothetical protein